MKVLACFLFAVLLTACSQAPETSGATPAATADDMKMSEAEHRQMASESARPAETEGGQKASAIGTVESVDATAGKITIAHGPVDALKWPAMTMAFAATPEQIASVQAGQQVQFEFTLKGMGATITTITPKQ